MRLKCETDSEIYFSYYDFSLVDFDKLIRAPKLDLQRFAAEDEGRTELPTETKKRRAREKGQVLKSQEIVALSSLVATVFSIFIFFPVIWQKIINVVNFFFQVDLSFNYENLDYFIKYILNQFLPVLAIIFIPPIVAGIIASVAQVGFLVVPSLITPNLSRIAPNFSAYFKRIFSVEGLVNLLKSLALVIGLLIIVFLAINSSLGNLFESVSDSYQKTIELGVNLFKSIFIRMIIILVIIVVIDYVMQRKRYIDSLKMSKQEILDELYEQEGRPEIRQALNKKRREIAQRKSLQNVKTADVVITNPTHFAVALKYEMGIDPAPKVVAKGEDLLAQQIKRIAFENDIITIENKPLARELYSRVSVGDYIPQDLLYVVANIYKYIYREYSKRKRAGYNWGGK